MARPLVTFKGWEGQWWKNIKVGKAAVSAAGWVAPLKWQAAAWGAQKMGLFGSVLKFGKGIISKVAPKIVGMVPGGGVIKTAINVGSKIAKRVGRKNLKRIATGGVAAVAAGGVVAGRRGGGGVMGGGSVTTDAAGNIVSVGGSRRRMNPGNVRAMRRAIRRVEMGARLYSKMFRIRHGSIKGAPNVRVVKFRRKAA